MQERAELDDLTALPNIGPALAAKLRESGIASYDELARLGSAGAMLRICSGEKVTRFNMLYALEGAIRGVRWHSISKDERAELRAELRRVEAG
jgi:DNA transformation protein